MTLCPPYHIGLGWVVSFTSLITMVFTKPSTFGVMLPIHHVSVVTCSREVIQRVHPDPPTTIHLSFIHSWPPSWTSYRQSVFTSIKSLAPFRVTDVGFIKALLWRIASCRHQLIIQGVDLGIPPSVLWSLHASMASFSLPATGLHQWPSTERFCVVFDAKSLFHTTWIVL